MLATDLAITAFGTSATNLSVTYNVATQAASAFDIGVYTSTDGVTLGTLLMTKRVTAAGDLSVGTGKNITFQATFGSEFEDYKLLARLDSSTENSESNETNNNLVFGGGVFLATDSVVHVHGTDSTDTVNLSDNGTNLTVSYNSTPTVIALSSTAAVSVRVHGNGDTVNANGLDAIPVDLFGGAGNDTLTGSDNTAYPFGDWIEGGAGNDTLTGGAGNDGFVYSGSSLGTDSISESTASNDALDFVNFSELSSGSGITLDLASTSSQTIATGTVISFNSGTSVEGAFGTADNDTIYGNSRDNAIEGMAGNDTIFGYGGEDELYGDDFARTLTGEDILVGGADDDYLFGGRGNDGYAYAGATLGTDHVYDVTLPFATNDAMDYFDFRDFSSGVTLDLSQSSNTVATGTTIIVNGTLLIEGAFGSNYADTITGDGRANAIEGLGGNDTIYGAGGADELYGDDGDDALYGEAGDDILYGDNGVDRLEGGAGNDSITGGDGDDAYVYALAAVDISNGLTLGTDVLTEETGASNDALDFFDFSGYGAAITLDLAVTTSQTAATGLVLYLNNNAAFEGAFGSAYNDLLKGNARDNYFEGLAGNDTIYGYGGNDNLCGDDAMATAYVGNDIIYGGDGSDTITGGKGDDDIFGEAGIDYLYGNDGNDEITGGSATDQADGGAGTDDEVDDIEYAVNFEL